MTDIHSKSFFGQNTGMIIKSNSKSEDFIFITCLRKKQDGTGSHQFVCPAVQGEDGQHGSDCRIPLRRKSAESHYYQASHDGVPGIHF